MNKLPIVISTKPDPFDLTFTKMEGELRIRGKITFQKLHYGSVDLKQVCIDNVIEEIKGLIFKDLECKYFEVMHKVLGKVSLSKDFDVVNGIMHDFGGYIQELQEFEIIDESI